MGASVWPPTAADGKVFVGTTATLVLGQQLKQPLHQGQHYWLCWDYTVAAAPPQPNDVSCLVNLWAGNTLCGEDETFTDGYSRIDSEQGQWQHLCIEFVALHDACYLRFLVSVSDGPGSTASFGLDGFRMGTTTPRSSRAVECSAMPWRLARRGAEQDGPVSCASAS
ncbi:MAG TPA: hypothetical protein VF331_04870 [Polyangiales bacterium]